MDEYYNHNDMELSILDESYSIDDSCFRKYGRSAVGTDLAWLTGCEREKEKYRLEDKTPKGLICNYLWTDNKSIIKNFEQVTNYDFLFRFKTNTNGYARCYGIRPVLKSPSVYEQLLPVRRSAYNDVKEVIFGEYPQYVPDAETQKELFNALKHQQLIKTNKVYTFDITALDQHTKGFNPVKCEEYEYNGKKYVMIHCKSFSPDNYPYTFSNGEKYKNGEQVWVEVSPITWFIHEESKTLISKKVLLSGIQYNNYKTKNNKVFKKSNLYNYLNTYMIKEIIPSKLKKEEIINETSIDNKEYDMTQLLDKSFIKDKETEIDLLIDEIIKYIDYSNNKDKTKEEVERIIKTNNDDLYELLNNKSILQLNTTETITNKTKQQLTSILIELKENHNKIKVYEDMLDIVNESKKTVFTKELKSDNEIVKIFFGIVNTSIKLLKEREQNEIIKELTNILDNHKKEINTFLEKPQDNIIRFNTIQEFERSLRGELQSILLKVRIKLSRNMTKEYINELINIMYINIEKNKQIQFRKVLDDIILLKENIINKINENPTEFNSYQLELNKLLDFNIDHPFENDEDLMKLYNLYSNLESIDERISQNINTRKLEISNSIVW